VPKPVPIFRDRANPKKSNNKFQKSLVTDNLLALGFGILIWNFGILIERAEIIPSEPDPVSTGEGKVLPGCKLLPHWLIV
jgi:hypothetical protein